MSAGAGARRALCYEDAAPARTGHATGGSHAPSAMGDLVSGRGIRQFFARRDRALMLGRGRHEPGQCSGGAAGRDLARALHARGAPHRSRGGPRGGGPAASGGGAPGRGKGAGLRRARGHQDRHVLPAAVSAVARPPGKTPGRRAGALPDQYRPLQRQPRGLRPPAKALRLRHRLFCEPLRQRCLAGGFHRAATGKLALLRGPRRRAPPCGQGPALLGRPRRRDPAARGARRLAHAGPPA